ncbi:MAG: formate dehydrogenase subunit gamma [Rhodobacteraceae bacterium]|nr:formate dehydrogenase subunit gamma [Paracoccaceae bacterium]
MPQTIGDRPGIKDVSWDEGEARAVIARFTHLKGGLMEALHGLQAAFGYIPPESYDLLADGFNLSRAEVYGVKSFYHDFRSSPAGHHVIQICQAESCQARGSRALTAHAQDALGIKLGETSSDGAFTLEAVYCLGNCAVSPNITLDGKLHARVSAERFDALVKGVSS